MQSLQLLAYEWIQFEELEKNEHNQVQLKTCQLLELSVKQWSFTWTILNALMYHTTNTTLLEVIFELEFGIIISRVCFF